MCVQDSAVSEESENHVDSDATAQSDTTSNLLSSGNLNYYSKFKYLNFTILYLNCTYLQYLLLIYNIALDIM